MSRLRQLSREEKEALVLRLEAGERVAAVGAETRGCFASRCTNGGPPGGRGEPRA